MIAVELRSLTPTFVVKLCKTLCLQIAYEFVSKQLSLNMKHRWIWSVVKSPSVRLKKFLTDLQMFKLAICCLC